VFDEKDSDKSAVRFLIALKKAVQPPKAIDPGKGAFDFPPLTTVAFMFAFVSGLRSGLRNAVLAIRGQRNDATLAEGFAQGVTVIAFIKAKASGTATPFTNFDAVDSFEDLNLVMAVGFTQRAVQGIAVGIDD
jgi:hypothetical protein